MLKSARHEQIRSIANDNGQVSVAKLNGLLNVNEATICRDLEEMSQLGWVRRTHGGAVRVERADREPPILMRQKDEATQKRLIGQTAVQTIISDNVLTPTTIAKLQEKGLEVLLA
ncbi:MAG: DeoR/GlpR transcriptional regulator [Chloroflexi bacterium]|nr:DeoR/GlpR transcriptional regulator [Chloroflexota bacterium]